MLVIVSTEQMVHVMVSDKCGVEAGTDEHSSEA